MTADETLLTEEICRSTSVSEALKGIADRRPPALIRRIQERAFPSQSLGRRLLIVLAGPLANILFAPLLLTIVFIYGIPRLLPVIGQIKPDLPAAVAGLKAGDRVTSINGTAIKSWEDLSNRIKASGGDRLEIDYQRGGDNAGISSVMVKPARDGQVKSADSAGSWIIGVSPRGDYIVYRVNPITAVGDAVLKTGKMSVMLVEGIYKIINGSTPVRQALGGPIMIAQIAGREAHGRIRQHRALQRDAESRAGNYQPAPGADARRRTHPVFPDRRRARQTTTSAPSRDCAAGWLVSARRADGVRYL